jgi:hypothetical protein
MKRQVFSLITIATLLLVAGSAVAQAIHVRGDVPFDFRVGSKTLRAGTYEVRTIDTRSGKMLRLQSEDGHTSMIVNSNSAESLTSADKTKLVFTKVRDQYFLTEIWEAGATRGHRLLKGSREKELAKELARSLNRTRVEIVASLY